MPDDEPDASDEETALTRTSSAALQRLDTNLEATERVLARSEDRYVRFFQEHEEFFVQLISRRYPIDQRLIENYKERWSWGGLSSNESLRWTDDLIDRYAHHWEWKSLSSNEALPWSEELIDRYADRWDWGKFGLSANEGIPWTEELIDRYADRWDWGVFGLSRNEALPWTQELVDRYADRWVWGESQKGIRGLVANAGLPWSLDLIVRYSEKWDWESLLSNRGVYEEAFADHITPQLIHRVFDSS